MTNRNSLENIPEICKGVKCMIQGCPEFSSHKVGEINIYDIVTQKQQYQNFENTHQLTTYLCENHFKHLMTREEKYSQKDPRFDSK